MNSEIVGVTDVLYDSLAIQDVDPWGVRQTFDQ